VARTVARDLEGHALQFRLSGKTLRGWDWMQPKFKMLYYTLYKSKMYIRVREIIYFNTYVNSRNV